MTYDALVELLSEALHIELRGKNIHIIIKPKMSHEIKDDNNVSYIIAFAKKVTQFIPLFMTYFGKYVKYHMDVYLFLN